MNKFKVGESVLKIGGPHDGEHGKIVDVWCETGIIKIELDGGIMWRCSENQIERIEQMSQIIIYVKGRVTHAMQKQEKKVIKTAKATCSPNDDFNLEHGARLALARLFNDKVIDIEIEKVKKPREVKRKAKVGEWIKVVDADDFSDNKYRNGDVMQVVKETEWGIYFGNCTTWEGLNNCEYVVLENYNPVNGPNKLFDYTSRELTAELLRRCENE